MLVNPNITTKITLTDNSIKRITELQKQISTTPSSIHGYTFKPLDSNKCTTYLLKEIISMPTALCAL